MTSPICLELIALLALTLEPNPEIDALVFATSVVDPALVDVAQVAGLVLPIAAVVVTVAHLRQRKTHGAVAGAIEFRFGVAARR